MDPRDGTPEVTVEKPKDRRIPMTTVIFKEPTLIKGCELGITNVTVGEARNIGGHQFTCPQPYFDPATRTIVIDGREYPIERVHYMERAKMARKVVTIPLPGNYRIGKR